MVRGRGLRTDVGEGLAPEFRLYLMGTALTCLAILDGVRPAEGVRYARQHYHPRAVETPWQRRYVRQFQP